MCVSFSVHPCCWAAWWIRPSVMAPSQPAEFVMLGCNSSVRAPTISGLLWLCSLLCTSIAGHLNWCIASITALEPWCSRPGWLLMWFQPAVIHFLLLANAATFILIKVCMCRKASGLRLQVQFYFCFLILAMTFYHLFFLKTSWSNLKLMPSRVGVLAAGCGSCLI